MNSPDPSKGADLRGAARLATDATAGLADLVVDATRPLDAVVDEVARWWADRG